MGAPELIPLFGLGVQKKSPPAIAQRRVNLYYELQEDQDRTRIVAYGTPGLELHSNAGGVPARGAIAPPSSPYAFKVVGSTFYQVDAAGTLTNRGTINTSSGRVALAENGRYIAAVDGTSGYYYDMAAGGAITQITDPLFFNGSNTIAWVDGYFVAALNGAFTLSEPGTAVNWSGDQAAAESSSDNILVVTEDHQDLTIFGAQSIEFWTNTGNPDFPFERIPGTTSAWGIAARSSLAKLDEAIAFLSRNEQGQVVAAKLLGHRVSRLSNSDLEAHWTSLGSTADATGYSYMLDGHPLYVVNIGGETWMYDGSTNGWFQLQSYGLTRHRGEICIPFNGGSYVTDYQNGKFYRLRPDVYTDNGDPIRRVITGRHVFDGLRRMGVDRFQLDIESGVGLESGQGENPQAMLRVSRDGGRTWGAERWASFGRLGQYKKRAMWGSCGRARDFVFEIAITDPVKVAILGAGIKTRMGKN